MEFNRAFLNAVFEGTFTHHAVVNPSGPIYRSHRTEIEKSAVAITGTIMKARNRPMTTVRQTGGDEPELFVAAMSVISRMLS